MDGDVDMKNLRTTLIATATVVVVACALLASCGSVQSRLTPNRDLVPCACYPDIATSGTPRGSSGKSVREYLFKGHQLRIRQDGSISKVGLYALDLADSTGVYITIWRQGESGYNRVGESENILRRLRPGMINTITLSHPIAGVMEGDYYGIRCEQNGTQWRAQVLARGDVLNAVAYWFDSNPGDTDVDWEGGGSRSSVGQAVPIKLYMRAPVIVAIGDSIVAGAPLNFTFINENPATDIASTFPYNVRQALGVTLQNMSIGNRTIGEIGTCFGPDCVALKPRIAIIEGGVKDLMNNSEKSTFLGKWTDILNACRDNGIQAVALGILPWTEGTSQEMQTRDDWNASLKELVGNYADFIYVDTVPYVGTARATGPDGNLWDIRPEFDADGIHFTPAGYEKIAQAVLDAMGS
jgi:lysophospholipase L1-like esterase